MSRLLALASAALVLCACAYLGAASPPYRPPAYYQPPPEDLAAADLGRFLFGRDCAFCHGSEGRGTDRGPGLRTGNVGAALVDFTLRTGRMPIGHEQEPIRRRPAAYDEEQIAGLVEFIGSEFDPPGPDIPEVDPVASEELATGQQLYQLHCASCHATTGIGGAILTQRETEQGQAGVIIPGIGAATPREIAEAVRTGPTSMPVFGPDIISDHELNALVGYVERLQDPPDPGGAGIGHIGPFMEGAVGWIVGLGALIAFSFWIGTRSGEEP